MRHCVRKFTDQVPEKSIIQDALNYARFAASAKNIQPWHIAVVSGKTLSCLKTEMTKQAISEDKGQIIWGDSKVPELYWQRAKELGFSLFKHKDISRDDIEARKKHFLENYTFFNAPYEIFFMIHSDMPERTLIDMGIFLERTMHSLQENNLGSCPQASVAIYPQTIRNVLKIDKSLEILFGLAVGFEYKKHHLNEFRTKKLEVAEFCNWYN